MYEKFWVKGMGVGYDNDYTVSGIQVKDWDRTGEDRWLDPHDPSVPLEVLLDGLERLEPAFLMYKALNCHTKQDNYWIYPDINEWPCEQIANDPDRRSAIIAAICRLAGIELEGK